MNLSPEIIKMREALLERIGDKSLKEVAQIVNEILLNETDSINRLAALAARVKVLRNYINKNYDIKNKPKKSELTKLTIRLFSGNSIIPFVPLSWTAWFK